MSKIITITLDDTSGALEVGMRFPGEFDPASQACQMANILLNYMDTIAVRHSESHEAVPAEVSAPKLILTP